MAKYSPEEVARLDARMKELDANLADMKAGKVRLGRGPTGKYQFKSTSTSTVSKPVVSKPAAKTTDTTPASGGDSDISSGTKIRKFSTTPADLAPFRAAMNKPRTGVGRTGTLNFSSDSDSSTDDSSYRVRGRGLPNEGSREALKDLSDKTSPRTNKLPPRKYSAQETKNMAEGEAGKKGSLTRQYGNENRLRGLGTAAAMMGSIAAGPEVMEAYEGATLPELLQGAARTDPSKLIPYEGASEALKKIGVNAPFRYKKGGKIPNALKGGKVGKVMGEFKSGSLKSSSGQKVTNRKQAIAIAMSEAGKSKMKKYSGKTDSRVFASGDVFSNYDVGDRKKNPVMNSRKDFSKGSTWSLDETKKGLTNKQVKAKSYPELTGDDDMSADLPKKKYAAGGKVKRMANGGMSGVGPAAAAIYGGMKGGMPAPAQQNPIAQMKQAANLVNTVKSEAAKRGMVPARPMAPDMRTPYPVRPPVTGYGPRMGIPPSVGTMPVYKKGGKIEESKKMVKQEVEFFKKKGAPKLARHEEKELAGMKRGGDVKKMAKGGGIERKGSGPVKKFAKGGSIDGCAVRGKTKLKRVKM